MSVDPILELEQMYGTVYCNICGDTGYIWGDETKGKCDCEEENDESEEHASL